MRSVNRQIVRGPGQESWRVFCAVDLTAAVRTRLMEHISSLLQSVPQAKASWSREQNLHLTLKFLGEIQASQLGKLSTAAAVAVENFLPFQISIEETGVFPKQGKPRVLWIGIKDASGRLAELHTRLEKACASEGFAKEERPFHPHLTLARLRKPEGARSLAAAHEGLRFEPAAVKVAELLVIRSELSQEGSKYTVISRHELGAHTDQLSM